MHSAAARAMRRLPIVSIMLLGGIPMLAVPAAADITLCSGASYSICTAAGYTDQGFGAHNSTSYWGAYSGHNCTNYVAYVEQTVNGAPPPTYQLGDASQWADNARAHGVAVNNTPARGAVAQWASGHVAYVESVNIDGSITISQDVYSACPFSWRSISSTSSGWPNNFIHFADVPSNQDVPAMGTTTISYNGGLHSFFYDPANGNLRHAWTSPTAGWQVENLDGDPGSIGHWNADVGRGSAVTTYGDSLQLFYYDASNGNLRHAWTGSAGWSFENLDGDPGSVGHRDSRLGTTQSATLYGDSLQLFYPDVDYQTYRHAWTSATSGWQVEDLANLSP
jgi:surface antigen